MCTTILVGKNASYDGSTMTARNDDAGAGKFTVKKSIVVNPEDQPRKYKSAISQVEIDLPKNPLRYTAVPNVEKSEGIWAAAGVSAENIGMTATETITSNDRVQGADPLVENGIGEEDLVVITLPYIHSAREGVLRLGTLLEKFGTYEMNAVAFQDVNEIWWFESVGGHHWIAKRVPDDSYVVAPNQFGIDLFDLKDALGEQKDHLCSADLGEFINNNHLDLSMEDGIFYAREAFGSFDDSDHTYNTPRAWFGERYFNPRTFLWDGPDAEYTPVSDDLPWSLVPERKITVEDIKYVLSSHFQGTEFDPYEHLEKKYRPIGVNRTSFVALIQLRPYVPAEIQAVEWIAFASNTFNSFVPFYANVKQMPAYVSGTAERVSTDNFYWASRLIGALADADFKQSAIHIERYQRKLGGEGHRIVNLFDKKFKDSKDSTLLEKANEEMAKLAQTITDECLSNVLYERSGKMQNGFSRSDA